jgi:hypothetical protein
MLTSLTSKTIEDLHKFTNITVNKMGKAVINTRLDTNEVIIVFIRADKEVNETKLRNLLKVDDEKLLEIVKIVKEEREKGFEITNEKFDEILLRANVKR